MKSALLAIAVFASLLQAAPQSSYWSAKKRAEIKHVWVPECVLHDATSGTTFLSNVAAEKDEYWTDDGKGFISILDGDKMKRLRWVNSTPDTILNGPKGMCLLDDKLYFTDNTRLMRCNAKDGSQVEVVLDGFGKANDLATDGAAVWLSDTKEGKIWRIQPDGAKREIPSPKGVNGLTFANGRMYAVSWDLHEVYEVFPIGGRDPVPFGLAEHFTNLDGIEVMRDGTFIVSDFVGNKVCGITPDRRSVYVIAELESPADIGIDRATMTLYVPQFYADKVAIFDLRWHIPR
jgi:sugar lactone lactonase YvrE